MLKKINSLLRLFSSLASHVPQQRVLALFCQYPPNWPLSVSSLGFFSLFPRICAPPTLPPLSFIGYQKKEKKENDAARLPDFFFCVSSFFPFFLFTTHASFLPFFNGAISNHTTCTSPVYDFFSSERSLYEPFAFFFLLPPFLSLSYISSFRFSLLILSNDVCLQNGRGSMYISYTRKPPMPSFL